jgi:hypothetical protein
MAIHLSENNFTEKNNPDFKITATSGFRKFSHRFSMSFDVTQLSD